MDARTDRLRARTPGWALGLLVKVLAARAARDPERMAEAIESMTFLLERGAPERMGEIDELARQWILSTEWYDAIKWHPEIATSQPVENLDAVRGLVGRGFVLNFAHLGQYDGMFGSLSKVGISCHVVAAAHMLEPDAPAVRRQHLAVVGSGGHVVSTEVGFAELEALLRRGSTLAIASDVAGRTPVTFAGRQVLGSFGAPRLAFAAGVPVVLCTAHPTPGTTWAPRLRLSEPLWPEQFASPEDMLQVIIQRHEEAILAWPTAYERPLVRWAVTPGS